MVCIDDCPIRKRLSARMRIKWYGFFCPWTKGKNNLCPSDCKVWPILKMMEEAKEIKDDVDLDISEVMNPQWFCIKFWVRR